MGLDSFWRHPSNTPESTVVPDPVFDPPLRLCGGLFSGNGQGSFRGKVYAPVVEAATGVSLYTEVIDAATVRRMTGLLDGPLGVGVELDADEAADLVRMFRAYGDAGFELCGWW